MNFFGHKNPFPFVNPKTMKYLCSKCISRNGSKIRAVLTIKRESYYVAYYHLHFGIFYDRITDLAVDVPA